jgi:hypothetical protein
MSATAEKAIIQATADSIDIALRAVHTAAALAGHVYRPLEARLNQIAVELDAINREAERLHQFETRKRTREQLDVLSKLDADGRAVLRKVEASGVYTPSNDERFMCESLVRLNLIVRGKLESGVAVSYRAVT